MYVKIINDKIIFPPHNCGNIINVHLNKAWLEENGYIDITQQQLKKYIKPKEQTKIYSKLEIRRAMRKLGIEDKLNLILNSNEIFKADWTDAQEINLNDQIFIQALNLGGITNQEIQLIIKNIN